MKRSARSQRGVAAVEFALVLPLLLTLLLGMIHYGWYFFIAINASSASREGARIASTYAGVCPNGAATAAASAAVATRMGKINYAGYTTTTATCAASATGDPEFQVKVQVLFPQLTGFTLIPMPRSGSSVAVNAETTMRGVP